MITLYQIPPFGELPSFSPFCVKLETWLRVSGLPYRTAPGDARKGPTKKVPYIDDDGQLLGDSGQILEHLAKKYDKDLDVGLSPERRATGRLVRRTVEEHLYWVIIYSQVAEDAGWVEVQKVFATLIPGAMRWLAFPIVRKSLMKAMHTQGVARHSRDQVYRLGVDDLDALAATLGDKPFFVDSEVRSVDCTAFAFLWDVLVTPNDNPLTRKARSLPNVVAYVDRLKQRYFAAGAGAPAGAQGASAALAP